jgi:hypothetical protein
MMRLTRLAVLGALLFIGPEPLLLAEEQAKKPRQPEPIPLYPQEVTVVGEALLYDPGSLEVWGPVGLEERTRESLLLKNSVALRSAVMVHFVRTASGLGPSWAGVSAAAPILVACMTDKSLNKYRNDGADLIVVWNQEIFTSATQGVPPFTAKAGCAAVATGRIEDYTDVHESLGHAFGAGHDLAHWNTGPGAVPWAAGFIASDGTCDVLSLGCTRVPIFSGGTYKGVKYGDAKHDNAKEINLTRGLVAAYSAAVPKDVDHDCVNDLETACVNGLRLQVLTADPNSPVKGYAPIRISQGDATSFMVGSAVVRVTATRSGSGIKLGITAKANPLPWRLVVTGSDGRTRAWQPALGQALAVTVPKF